MAFRDTSTGKLYYSNNVPDIYDGVLVFDDAKTGAAVTIRNTWESVDAPDTNYILVRSNGGRSKYTIKQTRRLNAPK